MKRRCIHCGCERETASKRTLYVCSAIACQRKARPKVGRASGRQRAYFERMKRLRTRSKRAGGDGTIYDS